MSKNILKKVRNQKLIVSVFSSVLLFAITAVGVYSIFFTNPDISKAGGVTPTITPSVQNVSTAASISAAFTTSVALPIGSQIQFAYNSGYTGTVTTANITVNGVAPSAVSNATTSGVTTSTLTTAAAITSGSTVTVATTAAALTTPISAGNYTFTVKTSADFGANFQYVGQANVVNVTAFVPINLSFSIRNSGDTANTNVCDLGTASTTAVSSCSYRLKVSTNAANGYTISAQAGGSLTNGTDVITNAVAGTGGTGGTNIVSGTERYGAVLTPGTITGVGGTISLTSAFNAGATNSVLYAPAAPTVILTANKPNSPLASGDTTRTSLITHNLGISSNTPSGSYTQSITYTVAPSF
jgi:hypothetical protein